VADYQDRSRFPRDLGVVGVPAAILKMLPDKPAASSACGVDAAARAQIFPDATDEGRRITTTDSDS
jgi:hypothetical protein